METFTFKGLLLRLLFSAALVLVTFNPTDMSYFHWLSRDISHPGPLLVVAGLALLIAWIFMLRSMLRSIGIIGALLAMAFLAAVVWLVVSWGWLDPGNATAMTWIVLASLSIVLALGLSWSILRRRITGQASVDEVGSP
jgi:hypothetical protein